MDGPHQKLSASAVPQADKLERVVVLVGARVEDELAILAGWNERDLHYYTQAARILDMLDDDGEPTALGRTAASQSEGELAATLANAFANSEVGRAWATWSQVHHLRQVDPNSACDFLTQASELADSTAQRRAAVLRRWHQDLFDVTAVEQDVVESESGFPPEVEAFLDLPADHHELPTRMVTWIESHSIQSYRELVAFDLGDLLGQRNLGRKSVAQTRALIEKLTGMDWSELHDGSPTHDNPEGADTPIENLSWSALAARMPECVRELALDQVKLPTRMKTYASARGLTTVGEIAVVPLGVLSKEPNLGRKSITGTREAFVELVRNPPSEAIPPSLDDYPSFWDLWKAQLGRLRAIDRMVITLRSGFSGEAKTLVEVGDLMGFTRERARQLEGRGIDELRFDSWWLGATRTRLEQALAGGLVPLEELQQDPWWAGLTEHESAFSYFLARLLDGSLHIVEVDADRILSAANAEEVDRAWRALCDNVSNLSFPVEVEHVKQLTAQQATQLGEGFERLFWTRLRAHLRTENTDDQVFGFGNTRSAEVISFLRSCHQPVKMMDLWAMFGRFHPPDELIYVERGVVTLPECVPDFDKWRKRLVPLCAAIMRNDERERQWSVVELLDEIRQSARVPDWLGHWHLAGMLKKSEEVNYLGRLRVALPDHEASEERIHIEPLLVRLLTDAKAPVPIQELLVFAREQTSVADLTYNMMVKRPPFVQVDEQRIGLIERDVPGGAEAIAEFEDALADALAKRQSGMSPTALTHFLTGTSETHKTWSWWMARSIVRGDDRFRLSQSGAVGLSEWDDVRVPTRAEILLACLNEDDGRTSVAKIQRHITELYGRCPSRTQVGLLANGLGARMNGPAVSRPDATLNRDSVLEQFKDIPAEAVPIVRELLAEPPIPFDTLRASVQQHVADIQAAARDNEFIDLEEAHELAETCLDLLERVEGEDAGDRRQLVQVAARYFAMSDDAESDFCLGGLDDDLAVVQAISGLIATAQAPSARRMAESRCPATELQTDFDPTTPSAEGMGARLLASKDDVPFAIASDTAEGDASNSFPILELAEAVAHGEKATPIAWCKPGCRRSPSDWLFVAAVSTHRTDGPKHAWCLFQWLRGTSPVDRWVLAGTPGIIAPETGAEHCVRSWKEDGAEIRLELRKEVDPLVVPAGNHPTAIAEVVETLVRDERRGRFLSKSFPRMPDLRERIPTKSTTILSAGYNSDERTMDLEFRDHSVYRYFEVPDDVFVDLVVAGRTGAFVKDHVRNRFRCERLGNDPSPPPTPLGYGTPGLKVMSPSFDRQERIVRQIGRRPWGDDAERIDVDLGDQGKLRLDFPDHNPQRKG